MRAGGASVAAANALAAAAVVFVAALASALVPADAAVIAACFGGPVSLGVGALGAFVWALTRSAPTGAKVVLRLAPLGLFAAMCAYLAFGALSPRAAVDPSEAARCLVAWGELPPGLVVRAHRSNYRLLDLASWSAFLFELPPDQADVLLSTFEDVVPHPRDLAGTVDEAESIARDLGAPAVQTWHLRYEEPWINEFLIGRTAAPDLYVGLCYYPH